MKKEIIGIAVAALLFGSSIGYAASSTLIGAKVTGLFTLQYTDKTKIADAIIINGSAYVPVRKMAEATGTELKVEGKTITLESTVETSPAIGEITQSEPVTGAPMVIQVPLTTAEKEILQTRITKSERALLVTREELAQAREKLTASTDDMEIQKLKKNIKELETSISGIQKVLDADKARIAAAE